MSVADRDPPRRDPAKYLRSAMILTALFLAAPWSARLDVSAQANTASISITKYFVTAGGQVVTAPGGSAAGVSFTLTPTLAGQPATVLTTNGAGQAFGALTAGTYTFQESTPAPGTSFVSASISQGGAQSQILSPGAAIPFSPGAAYSIFVTDQVSGQPSAGTATLTINKTLTTAGGQSAVGSLAGYSFTLAGQNGLPTQTQVTNPLGQASFVGIPAGIYSIAEAPAPGSTFASMTINGVAAQQQQAFQVQPAGNYEVDVTNLVSGSGNISIQLYVVDQTGQPATTNLSGYSFTLTPQTGSGQPLTVTTSITGAATANLAPGAYTIDEAAPASASLIGYSINGVASPTGQFTVGLGQTTLIVVTNRAASSSPATLGGRSVNLQSGCNNVVSTFPDGTAGQILAGSSFPAGTIVAIWKFDNASQSFRAIYFPAGGTGLAPPVDVNAVNWLDPIFLCVSAPTTLTEPAP